MVSPGLSRTGGGCRLPSAVAGFTGGERWDEVGAPGGGGPDGPGAALAEDVCAEKNTCTTSANPGRRNLSILTRVIVADDGTFIFTTRGQVRCGVGLFYRPVGFAE